MPSRTIVEIKARCANQEKIRQLLLERKADFKGFDRQIDTYFRVPKGKLKLREGNIENALVYYEREEKSGPKQSNVLMESLSPDSSMRELLSKALGVLVAVVKKREIYFIDNVKFHIDDVKGLGTFVEIEAIDSDGSIGKKTLLKQCREYLRLFRIPEKDLVSVSYSDLLLKKQF